MDCVRTRPIRARPLATFYVHDKRKHIHRVLGEIFSQTETSREYPISPTELTQRFNPVENPIIFLLPLVFFRCVLLLSMLVKIGIAGTAVIFFFFFSSAGRSGWWWWWWTAPVLSDCSMYFEYIRVSKFGERCSAMLLSERKCYAEKIEKKIDAMFFVPMLLHTK